MAKIKSSHPGKLRVFRVTLTKDNHPSTMVDFEAPLAGRFSSAARHHEASLTSMQNELATVVTRLQHCQSELCSKQSSILTTRRQLLDRQWRTLRGVDWENYLAEVCTALGATAELTKMSGDQGVDLVVVFGARRVAIQAKGWANVVGNSAVQEVVAGRVFYHCDACAVITNSYFTPSAIQLAKANGCVLISENNFMQFALGDIPL